MAQSGVKPWVAMARDVPLARAPLASAIYEPRIPDAYPAPAPLPSTEPAIPLLAPAPAPSFPPSVPKPSEPRNPGVDRSTWERHALTPDVELHVRRPLDRRSNKRVEQLIRIARELFDDEA